MKRMIIAAVVLVLCAAGTGFAQGFDAEPVFSVKVATDRAPVVAGGDVRLP